MTSNATTALSVTEQQLEVFGGAVQFFKAGKGDPVLLLHRDNGHPGWSRFEELLAKNFTVYLPSHPGFHNSDPPAWTWMESVRDLAAAYQGIMDALGLQKTSVIGHGFGGWLAAELATLDHDRFLSMVLVNPMGILPRDGEIFDQFIVNAETYARTMVSDQSTFDAVYGAEPPFEQLEAWETDREMSTRIAWRPYMYNRALPNLLAGVDVDTLVIAGTKDGVVPNECAQMYTDALPNSRLAKLPAGHALELERPEDLAKLCIEHIGA